MENLMLVSVSEMLASPPTIKPDRNAIISLTKESKDDIQRQPGISRLTNKQRSAGLGKVVESVAAKNMANDERKNKHHNLKENPHSGSLLLLPRAPFLRR